MTASGPGAASDYEAWESIDETCGELIDYGEHVVSTTTSRGRGRFSGVDVAWTHYGVWTFRGGKIVRVAWFPTREDAFEAVGLSEYATAQENARALALSTGSV